MSHNNQQTYVLAYIDILGFKEYVINNFNDSVKLLKELQKYDNYKIKPHDGLDTSTNLQKSQNPITTMVSDSIIISYKCYYNKARKDPTIGYVIRRLQQNISWLADMVLREGLLIRGAISHGEELYHGNGIIVGSVYQNAYRLESECAIYPRVLIAPETMKYLSSTTLSPYISKDFDGIGIINYIHNTDCCEQDMIRFGIDRPSFDFREKVLKKINELDEIINGKSSNASDNNLKISTKWNYLKNKLAEAKKYYNNLSKEEI